MYVGYINGTTFYVVYYLLVIVTRVDVDHTPKTMYILCILFEIGEIIDASLVIKEYAPVDPGDAFM